MKTILLWLLLVLGTALLCTGCASLENKAVAIGSEVDGGKIETSGSISTGTFLPNVFFGGAVNALATAPVIKDGDATQVVFVRTLRRSFFGSLFGLDVGAESISYIGTPGETAAETAARFEAFAKVTNSVKDTATASTAASEATE